MGYTEPLPRQNVTHHVPKLHMPHSPASVTQYRSHINYICFPTTQYLLFAFEGGHPALSDRNEASYTSGPCSAGYELITLLPEEPFNSVGPYLSVPLYPTLCVSLLLSLPKT